MGNKGRRRYSRREEGAPGIMEKGCLWMLMKLSLGSGGVDEGEGWVEFSGELDGVS